MAWWQSYRGHNYMVRVDTNTNNRQKIVQGIDKELIQIGVQRYPAIVGQGRFDDVTRRDFARVEGITDLEYDAFGWALGVHIMRMRNEAVAAINSGSKEFPALIGFAIGEMYEILFQIDEIRDLDEPLMLSEFDMAALFGILGWEPIQQTHNEWMDLLRRNNRVVFQESELMNEIEQLFDDEWDAWQSLKHKILNAEIANPKRFQFPTSIHSDIQIERFI